MTSLLKRFTSYSAAPAAPSVVPDLMLVLSKKTVTQDDYAALHAVAVRLEERALAAERGADVVGLAAQQGAEVAHLRAQLTVRERALKIAVAAVVLALFLPGLLSLLFSVAILALLAFYFLDVQPVRGQVDALFGQLAHLFHTASSRESIAAATAKAQLRLK
jgi:hypothetical protein